MQSAKLSLHHILKNISHPQTPHKYFKIYKRWLCAAVNQSQEAKSSKVQDDIKRKILYNDVLSIEIKRQPKKDNPAYTKPIFLSYLEDEKDVSEPEVTSDENVHLPFEVNKKFIIDSTIDKPSTEIFEETLVELTPSDNVRFYGFSKENLRFDYLKINESKEDDDVINDTIDDNIKYGTSDPYTPVSSIPCGGCGAMLHCCSPSIPGFIPQEVFKRKSDKKLRSEICQRCHFLREFNLALGVNVSPIEYTQIVGSLKSRKAFPLVIVDMTDFPCSINPEIFKLLGAKSFFVVGNKVDLFIQEGTWFLNQLKESLIDCLERRDVDIDKILHVGLISAKTGYGIEELINKIHKFMFNTGDMYLIGCTNVGKSTLFNTFINSDLCKVQAMDLMQRATISTWPGTTLNLLKFPLTTFSSYKLHKRVKRLIQMKFSVDAQAQHKIRMSLDKTKEQIPLFAPIERTQFLKVDDKEKIPTIDYYSADMTLNDKRPPGLNPEVHPFNKSKWCHDTPGVVFEDQIINLLTTPELLLTIPREMLKPRNFRLREGYSLFIGGLARLDFVKGPQIAWFTVYASKELPITVTKTEDASQVYEELLGSKYLRVPHGGKARLEKWPGLSSKTVSLSSRNSREAAGDVVLSNAGWISVTMSSAYRCVLEAWTPEKKGIHVRDIPVIKLGHKFRGRRIQKTPAFETEVEEVSKEKLSMYLDNYKKASYNK